VLRKRKNITKEPDRGGAERSTLSLMMNYAHDAMGRVPWELVEVTGSGLYLHRLTTNAPILRAEGTRMRVFPWPSRAAKQHEKRDGLETQGVGFNLQSGAFWMMVGGITNPTKLDQLD